jgi:glucokinase
MPQHVLAGDIGGTKSNLGVFRIDGTTLHPVLEEKYHSADFPSVTDLLKDFLQRAGQYSITAGCLGFAGPVIEGRSKSVNLGWEIDQKNLQKFFDFPNLTLLNDLVALACGLPFLEGDQLIELKKGERRKGSIALLAAGTGLGEAAIIEHDGHFIPLPSEGGHKDFSPRNQQEWQLLRYLAKNYGRVSTERILSGFGIIEIYCFLLQQSKRTAPDWLAQAISEKDAGYVSRQALEHRDSLAMDALTIFASIYGSEAGNLALQYLATGGVYLGGGIAPKLHSVLEGELFQRSFLAKGRMMELMKKIPVFLINDSRASLLGAAYYAAGLL